MITFYDILKENLKIPVIYTTYKGEPPRPPFIAYKATGQDRFLADDTIFLKENTYRLEYYFENKDEDLESQIEDILLSNNLIYSKSGDIYIESENISLIYYEV